jgi:hypothetical protein
MNTQFTYRDFIVFFFTGVFAIVVSLIIFYDKINNCLFLNEINMYIKNNQAVSMVIIIPSIYLVGHIVHIIDFALLKFHVNLYKLHQIIKKRYSNKKKIIKLLAKLFMKSSEFLFYNYRVAKAIIKVRITYGDTNLDKIFWNKFYTIQIQNKSALAEYWHNQNDLFRGLYLICLISIISTILLCKIIFSLIFMIFAYLFYKKAEQYANNFVEVVNLTFKNLNKQEQTDLFLP